MTEATQAEAGGRRGGGHAGAAGSAPQPGGLDARDPGPALGGAGLPLPVLLHRRQPLRDHPPDRGHRRHRRRDDLRHPLRRHRPLGRLGLRQLGHRGRSGLQGHQQPGPGAAGDRRHRGHLRPPQRAAHHRAAGAALHRHARHDGHRPRLRPHLRQRGADLRAGEVQDPRAGEALPGDPGPDRHHPGGLRARLPGPQLHALRPVHLRHREQPRGRPPLRRPGPPGADRDLRRLRPARLASPPPSRPGGWPWRSRPAATATSCWPSGR